MAKRMKMFTGSANNLEEVFDEIREMMEKDPMFGGKGKHAKDEDHDCNSCDQENCPAKRDVKVEGTLELKFTDASTDIKCDIMDIRQRTFAIAASMAHLLGMIPGNIKGDVLRQVIEMEQEFTSVMDEDFDDEDEDEE